MATVNSLGIGSGVLTSDLIDQLREADENTIIKPLENEIELANQKEDAYAVLENLMTTFQNSTRALDSDTLYLARSTTGSTDEVSVTALDGVDVQSFTITDAVKAQSDVWNSTSLGTRSEALDNLGDGTLTIGLDGTDYDIVYDATSSLDDIRNAINEQAGDVMTASILQVGEDTYQLVITATDTNKEITFSDSNSTAQVDTVTLADNTLADGDEFSLTIDGFTVNYVADVTGGDDINSVNDALKALMDGHDFGSGAGNDFAISTSANGVQTITALNVDTAFTSSVAVVNDPSATATISSTSVPSSTAGSLSSALNLNNIQTANAATFKYNGIEITRDTNEIDDLIVGVTITLNKDQAATDSTNIAISQNSTSISTEMSLLVSSYNALMTNIDDMTKSDRETGAVGIFNGESFVKSIKRDITNALLEVNSDRVSLVDYGIELDRDGVMSFDASVFDAKFKEDPKGLETYFSGSHAVTAKEATATTAAVEEKSAIVGLFESLDAKMTNYTGYNQLLSSFSDQLLSSKVAVTDQYDRQKASLDSRYEILTQKFIAYDAMISKLNNSFSVLESAIEAQYVQN